MSGRKKFVRTHHDLEIYQIAFELAMRVFELSKKLPIEERYSMTDQMRRSSCSAAANITEGWRKRRYEAAFISKLSDAETEAAETQTWLDEEDILLWITLSPMHRRTHAPSRLFHG